jgi:hypothetical protein
MLGRVNDPSDIFGAVLLEGNGDIVHGSFEK